MTFSSNLIVNMRFARVSRSFSVLGWMNYEYFKPCHWITAVCSFPPGRALAGKQIQAGTAHLLQGQRLHQWGRGEVADTEISRSHAQLFIPPARTACLLMTNHWDSFLWPQLVWASQACACGLVRPSPVALR